MTSSLSLMFDDDTLLSAVHMVEEFVNKSLSLTLIISTFSVVMVIGDDVNLIQLSKASKNSKSPSLP